MLLIKICKTPRAGVKTSTIPKHRAMAGMAVAPFPLQISIACPLIVSVEESKRKTLFFKTSFHFFWTWTLCMDLLQFFWGWLPFFWICTSSCWTCAPSCLTWPFPKPRPLRDPLWVDSPSCVLVAILQTVGG